MSDSFFQMSQIFNFLRINYVYDIPQEKIIISRIQVWAHWRIDATLLIHLFKNLFTASLFFGCTYSIFLIIKTIYTFYFDLLMIIIVLQVKISIDISFSEENWPNHLFFGLNTHTNARQTSKCLLH